MIIYSTRHGKTEWNKLNKVSGITDIELADEGREQAKELSDKLADKGIDLIIASPMKRAYETACILNMVCKAELITDERLREQNYGIFEGVNRFSDGFLNNKRHFAYKYPGGESMMQLAYRVYGLLEEIKEKYADKTVLLVSHGGICRVINTYFHDMTNEEYFHYSQDNCSLMEYEI